ncbi:hypothetical protein [Rhodococcus opacus]|uniref:Uncharacterized protein n=1 Tax=Rhodococcus opacus TaxID=37919 RepID=A0A2S8J700_RHOOP|nr:hypothetical protein [Rhodococcus opacus]PQP22824.1 hypothetical protein C5613_22465 [Rhodococcus opacus]
MHRNIIRTSILGSTIAVAGFGSVAAAGADTVIQPGAERGAYCSVVADEGTVTDLNTPSQCIQARIAIHIDDRRAERLAQAERTRQDRADAHRADRADR